MRISPKAEFNERIASSAEDCKEQIAGDHRQRGGKVRFFQFFRRPGRMFFHKDNMCIFEEFIIGKNNGGKYNEGVPETKTVIRRVF